MKPQVYEERNGLIRRRFFEARRNQPAAFADSLKFSWSNWGFGMEPLAQTAARLRKNGVEFIELHGNRYGADLGYRTAETRTVLADHGVKVAGICGMFSADNDLSSNSPQRRQAAIDYIRRNLELGAELGARYFLVVPGAVGRPAKYDDMEFARSVETLAIVADEFVKHGIRGAVEPIRAAEVSFCRTFADAKDYIAALNHPGIRHINGDVYHMQVEESHIGEALMGAAGVLTNLHMADSNRGALGSGSMDIDTIIMALYAIGFAADERAFVTPEPLGPGGDPYPAMYGRPDPEVLDRLVADSVRYFRERERLLRECEQ